MFGLGVTEIIVILVFLILVFGHKKIPEFVKSLKMGAREFKKGRDTEEDESSSTDKKS